MKLNLTNPAIVDITCKRGDTFIFDSLKFWSDSAKTVPLDITGNSFAMQVKDINGLIILSFTMASDFTIVPLNILEIKKTATNMMVPASPNSAPYLYDLEMTDTSLNVSTIMKGSFIVLQDITNA